MIRMEDINVNICNYVYYQTYTLPYPGQMYPRGQLEHSSWPIMKLNVPGKQGSGSRRPVLGQNVPTGHGILFEKGQ